MVRGGLTPRFAELLGVNLLEIQIVKKKLRELSGIHLDDTRSRTDQDDDRWEAFLQQACPFAMVEFPLLERKDCNQVFLEYMSKFLGARAYQHRQKAQGVSRIRVRHRAAYRGSQDGVRLSAANAAPYRPRHSPSMHPRPGGDSNPSSQLQTRSLAPPAYEATATPVSSGVMAVDLFLREAGVPNLLQVLCSAGVNSQEKLQVVASWHASDLFDFLYELRREGYITRFDAKLLEVAFRKL
ncbi:hypothetical protein HYDPIDRAFT_24415 [Hydnomerulius pinastri MD-312]|nr:hypothetical protein HYDPIDRAFT_24415 [Hydnomerulius pinastri MD-312]